MTCTCRFNDDGTINVWCEHHLYAVAVSNHALGGGPERVKDLEAGLRSIAEHAETPDRISTYIVERLLPTPTTQEAKDGWQPHLFGDAE